MNHLPSTGSLIPRNRLRGIPQSCRLAHEYCFFVHDECVRVLAEYESVQAGWRTISFKQPDDHLKFEKLSEKFDVIYALRSMGYKKEARRVVLNQITAGLTSDFLHHIYEALSCLERRKSVVAFNLLRKPLTDNLILLSWMLADEDYFYKKFENESPLALTPSKTGNIRHQILSKAISKLDMPGILTADLLIDILFNSENSEGLYGFFQHAVHLVTVQKPSLSTYPENLNFIFKNPGDDDVYELIYGNLPLVINFGANVIMKLYDRIKSMDEGAANAFHVRTKLGLMLLYEQEWRIDVMDILSSALKNNVKCDNCKHGLKITVHNAARLLMTESFRCTRCRRVSPFPLSWVF